MPDGTIDEIADYIAYGYWHDRDRPYRRFDENEISVDISDLQESDQILARKALDLWSDVAAISFYYVSDGGQITIKPDPDETINTSDVSGSTINSSTITINPRVGPLGTTSVESDRFETLLHEIGHALGLGHSGDYNHGDWPPREPVRIFDNDTLQLSAMSYYRQSENTGSDATDTRPLTPQIADILALQSLYGVNLTTRRGDDTYGVGNTTGRDSYGIFAEHDFPTVTIYDMGGFDTLDYSGTALNQTIDLRPESFSSVYGEVENIIIARDTIIEAAVGGEGNDMLIGNFADNVLRGGDGNDTLIGNAGADQLFGEDGTDILKPGTIVAYGDLYDGGAGFDKFDFSDRSGDYLVNLRTEKFDTIVPGPAGPVTGLFTSTLVNIEEIIAGSGNDVLIGDAGNNTLRGGDGNDMLVGMGGGDWLLGEDGNDTLLPGLAAHSSDDIYNGGNGIDLIDVSANTGGVFVDLVTNEFDVFTAGPSGPVRALVNASVLNIENVRAGKGDDEIYGDRENNTIHADNGNDLLTGDGGDDELFGEWGNDVLNGGTGNDFLDGGYGNDRFEFDANFGHDTVSGFATGWLAGDVIAFESAVLADFETVMMHATQVGTDVVIAVDADNSVTLQGVQLSALSAGDFDFF